MLRKLWRAIRPQDKAAYWRSLFYREVVSHGETLRYLEVARQNVSAARSDLNDVRHQLEALTHD